MKLFISITNVSSIQYKYYPEFYSFFFVSLTLNSLSAVKRLALSVNNQQVTFVVSTHLTLDYGGQKYFFACANVGRIV